MSAQLQEEDFRVIVGDEDSTQGQTHILHLDAEKNETLAFRAPVSYATKFGHALLFEQGYFNLGLLVRIQRRMPTGQWIDHD
jgi:hypothetical protein